MSAAPRAVPPALPRVLLAVLVGILALAGCGDAGATGVEVRVEDARSPRLRGEVGAAAVYLRLHNDGEATVRLTGASTPAAGRVVLHRTVAGDDGLVTMVATDDLPVPGGHMLQLVEGGNHLMLLDPRPVAQGDSLPLTLHLTTADGPFDVEVDVDVTDLLEDR